MKTYWIAIASLTIIACQKKENPISGKILALRGSITVEQIHTNGKKEGHPAQIGQKLNVGDTIITGKDGNAIIELASAKLEVQKNTRLTYERGDAEQKVFLEHGTVWTNVNPVAKSHFSARTPTVVAAVRGTKFLLTADNPRSFICHCEGKVASTNTLTSVTEVNNSDYQEYFRDKKNIKVTTPELATLGVIADHAHSEIDDSPLGKKSTLTPEKARKVQDYVEKKFAALLNK
ncbi:MAG: hypothetical protein LDLANPLL_00987 [Turneriella sp.]|nr:hypothetical protein [Turneriella sp.]